MKFMHLSDLHIGKRVNDFSMLEDQQYILTKIINIADESEIDSVIIAGDIYDKSVPSAEAIQLFDNFITKLSRRDISIFAISGNHDSPERIAFGSRLMNSCNVYFSPVFDGSISPVKLTDDFGDINIYMMPFIKPANVRQVYPNLEVESYNDGVKAVIESVDIDVSARNILIAHQFVTGAQRCESEEMSVGGLDNVDATIFEDFDYVALGHMHGPQYVQRETIRYSGTPLKYSFSEVNHEKCVSMVEFTDKGRINIDTIPLIPKRDMRGIKGSYEEVTALDNYKDTNTDDYVHITLTDEEDIPDAIVKLRAIYPNIMRLDYDNSRTRLNQNINVSEDIDQKTPVDLFEELYRLQNNQEMSEEQRTFTSKIMEEIWEEHL